MSFTEAVKTVFSKYATFSGRARRSEYWWWWLFVAVVAVILSLIDNAIGLHISDATIMGLQVSGLLTLIFGLVTLIPGIAVTFRRLHDTGRSGWWWLLSLLCGIGAIIVFISPSWTAGRTTSTGPTPRAPPRYDAHGVRGHVVAVGPRRRERRRPGSHRPVIGTSGTAPR